MITLPPFPVQDIAQFPYVFQEWLRKLNSILTLEGVSWEFINFTDSDLVDIEIRNHNDLQNLQGGTAAQYYHLTSAQKAKIDLFTTTYVVGSLPSAATSGAGAVTFVTDANTTIILGIGTTVVGGGANKVPVYSDGANWIIG